jgi:hypothetical protein
VTGTKTPRTKAGSAMSGEAIMVLGGRRWGGLIWSVVERNGTPRLLVS